MPWGNTLPWAVLYHKGSRLAGELGGIADRLLNRATTYPPVGGYGFSPPNGGLIIPPIGFPLA
jgi:hypothetical protein